MFATTTRPLSGDERERLRQRCDELERRVAAAGRDAARTRRRGLLAGLMLGGFWAAIAGFNLVMGTRSAMWVALAATVLFTAGTFVVCRPFEHSFAERGELERLRSALIQDTVQVYELIADAAIVLHEPGDEDSVVGYLFRVSEAEVVHVEREHCGSIAPGLLPPTHLRVEWAAPLGVIGAQAQGERIAAAQRCPLAYPAALEPHIMGELMAYPTTLEQLAHHLADMNQGSMFGATTDDPRP